MSAELKHELESRRKGQRLIRRSDKPTRARTALKGAAPSNRRPAWGRSRRKPASGRMCWEAVRRTEPGKEPANEKFVHPRDRPAVQAETAHWKTVVVDGSCHERGTQKRAISERNTNKRELASNMLVLTRLIRTNAQAERKVYTISDFLAVRHFARDFPATLKPVPGVFEVGLGVKHELRLPASQQVEKRRQQIVRGVETVGYQNYVSLIPKERRNPQIHPMTPDFQNVNISKRRFDDRMREWRRQLHNFDDLEKFKQNNPGWETLLLEPAAPRPPTPFKPRSMRGWGQYPIVDSARCAMTTFGMLTSQQPCAPALPTWPMAVPEWELPGVLCNGFADMGHDGVTLGTHDAPMMHSPELCHNDNVTVDLLVPHDMVHHSAHLTPPSRAPTPLSTIGLARKVSNPGSDRPACVTPEFEAKILDFTEPSGPIRMSSMSPSLEMSLDSDALSMFEEAVEYSLFNSVGSWGVNAVGSHEHFDPQWAGKVAPLTSWSDF